jgi:MFS family permease
MGALLLAITTVGLTSVAGQLLTPLAGRVVGTVASGILIGILVSRTISGLVAGAAGWRAIYAFAAVAALVFAVLLYRATPPLAPKTRMAYPALIASVVAVVLRERTVRWTLMRKRFRSHLAVPSAPRYHGRLAADALNQLVMRLGKGLHALGNQLIRHLLDVDTDLFQLAK